MKLPVALILTVIVNGSQTSPDSDTLRSYGHWQCSLPLNKSLVEVVTQLSESFETTGYSPWMINKRSYISCYQRGLRTVPQGLNSGVQILNLGRNSITHIKKNDFAGYKKLEAVLMRENCFSANIYQLNDPSCSQRFIKIESGAFAYLSRLNLLYFSYNKIQTVPVNLPSSLKSLTIEMAELGQLNSTSFKTLKNLQTVALGRNCIEAAMPKLCSRNFSMENFNFSSNNLSYLNLPFNNLKKVPSGLFSHTLVGINLQGNPIHIIRSDDFSSCPNITFLVVSWTSKYDKKPLKIENGAFDDLIHLVHLDLSGNMLLHLPDLSLQTKLSWLGIAFNCLKMSAANPTNISSSSLTEIQIFGNTFCNKETYPFKTKLQTFKLGDAFLNFSKLEILLFQPLDIATLAKPSLLEMYWVLSYGYQYNCVDETSLKVLQHLPKLRWLSLALSGIRAIDISMFCDFNLSIIDLSANEINQLSAKSSCQTQRITEVNFDQRTYSKMDFLHFLSHYKKLMQTVKNQGSTLLTLSRNNLGDLPSYAFKCFSTTTFLDLSYNKIKYIQKDTFLFMRNLQTLDLQFNPVRHIFPSSQTGLAKLGTLSLNYSSFQSEFTLLFLQHTSNNITLHYGDITDTIYHLLSAYRKNKTKFNSVVSITFSNIPVMIYDVLNNCPIFEPFPNLQQITLEYARLSTSLGENFFGVSNVTNVTLRNCLLREFPHKALKDLPKLRYLDLSYNYLESLNKSCFDHISNLTFLSLSHNFIRHIVPKTLHLLVDKGLQNLDLSYNFISDVSNPIIDHHILSKLLFLDLRNNPLKCDCSLTRSFRWLVYSKNSSQLHIPGFLPICPVVISNYYGGCLTCNSARGFLSQPPSLFLFSVSNICEEQFLIILTTAFTLPIFIFILLSVMSNWKPLQNRLITSWLQTNLVQTNEDAEDSSSVKYAFDAFVIYDKADSSIGDWVDFSMVPKLKNGFPSLKIGVVEKEDWSGLIPAVQQLLLRIEASYKTVILLTDSFAQSLQCKYILAMLEQKVYTQGGDNCVIITFQKHPPTGKGFQMRRRRNQWSVLNLPDLNKDDSVFVELLRNAIAKNRYV